MASNETTIVKFCRDVTLHNADLTLGRDNPGLIAYGANAIGENVEAVYDAEQMPTDTLDAHSDVTFYHEATETEYQAWLEDREHRGLATEQA